MCFYDVDCFKFKGIKYENGAAGGRNVGTAWWSMRRRGEGGGRGFLRKRICKVAVFGRWREGTDRCWIIRMLFALPMIAL